MPGFRLRTFARSVLLALAPVAAAPAFAQADAATLYQRNCASCHGAERQGTGLGPPLSADTYRYGGREEDVARVIRNGVASRGMPAFGDVLSTAQIDALADFLPSRQSAPEPTAEEEQAAEPPPHAFDAVPGVVDTLDYAVRVERFAQGLETVWSIAFIDDRTALVAERPGRLRIIRDGVLQPQPVAGLPPIRVQAHVFNQGGLFDIAIDPDYRDNGWIYLSYSHGLEERGPEGDRLSMTRVVRGRLRDDNTWVDGEVVYEADRDAYGEAAWHFGGRMLFDREGRLYVSTGDRRAPELAREPGWPGGKIHRVMPDGSIPPDNPFVGRSDALASVYSVGHRNPQGMAIDPATGRIWATEHGPRGGDELNLIVRGGDYGWPVVTHGINYNGTVLTPHVRAEGVEQPAWYWRPSIGVSGLAFYDGGAFPLWRGKLLVTGLAPRELRLLTLDGERVQHEETLLTTEGRPYEPVVGPDGAIYVVTDAPGEVLRLSVQEERRL